MINWRNTAKQALVRAGRRLADRSPARAAILCYHSVHPTLPFRSVSPELFDRHLDWLGAHCQVVPLRQLVQPGAVTPDPQRPTVAITFDDGYRDNYEQAFPRLARHHLPATFFITVGFLDRDPRVLDRFQFLRARPLADLDAMSWDQVREMARSAMEIAAHTFSHPNLARLDRAQQEQELIAAKQLLENRLGQPVPGFAYPFGKPRRHFTPLTVEILQRAGHTYAAATFHRRWRPTDSPFELPRLFVNGDSVETLRDKVTGAHDPIGGLQARTPLWLARRVSPGDFAV